MALAMAAELFMPQLDLATTEGKVVRWLKTEGASVHKGEPLVEIEGAKTLFEIESPVDGVLGPALASEGTVVLVGQVIGHVLVPGEKAPVVKKTVAPSESVPTKAVAVAERPPSAKEAGGTRASPQARQLAEELGVDLSTVQGTGPNGRIVGDDVRRAAQNAKVTVPGPEAPASAEEVEGLSGIRRVVAERMTLSFTTAPHFYIGVEVDAAELVKRRENLRPKVEAATGTHLTITDMLIQATAKALREFPEVNVAWVSGSAGEPGGVHHHPEVGVGIAVATTNGLVVAVVHEADKLSLEEITRRRLYLTEKGQKGRLTPAEMDGGMFTLSNLGMFGVDQFQAIINPPQDAILAVGRIKERPVAINGNLAIRPTMFLTLSVDHRMLDGAQAARFLQRVVQLIEEPHPDGGK